ncbi:MAG: type II toxin-antitoxin system VapC family toxin [Treponema sp.]|nr:type II toxin-antitoxin system VapC family toxin [Treponema sp.]
MKVYLDSSVVLRYLLNADETLMRIGDGHEIASSELLDIECRRVLQRERLAMRIDDELYAEAVQALDSILDMISIIELGKNVLHRAGESFPTVIGTLDALHLASALLWRESEPGDIAILTYDKQLALCAKALDIPAFGAKKRGTAPR